MLGYGTHYAVEDVLEFSVRLRGELFGEISDILIPDDEEIRFTLELAGELGKVIGNLLAVGWSGVTDDNGLSESFEIDWR